MAEYYMLRNNQTAGPYRPDEIRAWAAAGQLTASDLFAPAGGQQWAPIGQWPELTSYPGAGQGMSAGLNVWITRGWQIVSSDPAAFILAALIAVGLSIITLGICAPPLSAGLYSMALRKHDGYPVRAGDVTDGFRYFGATWGLTLIIMVPVMIVLALIFGIAFAVGGTDLEKSMPFIQMGVQLPASALSYLIGTIMLFAIPVVVDRDYGSIQALQESWAAVKPQFWSYLGIFIIFSLIGGAGALACYVGLLFTQPLCVACIVSLYRSRFPAKR
jgi:uncharacterized membrane protein